jgi:hypothetical protein
MSFLGKIQGLVSGVTRKMKFGGRRRNSAKKGGAYLLRPRPMVRPPTPASSEPRRRRKTAKKGRGYLLRPRPMVAAPTPASSEPRRRRKTKKAKKN